MNLSSPPLPPPNLGSGFSPEQKEYLSGLLAGAARRGSSPFVGVDPSGRFTDRPGPAPGDANLAAASSEPPPEPTLFGVPLSEVTQQELWKHAENPLDSWERVIDHAVHAKFPDAEDTFRLRYFGMFYVAPAQNSFMLRCRIPAGELTGAQLHGLADIASEFADAKAALTTRSNLQIRQIAPRHLVDVLMRLQSLGLTAKGAGVDNVRNITASPTAGIDPQELVDTRPFAHALHPGDHGHPDVGEHDRRP